jgi:hypothetical protein
MLDIKTNMIMKRIYFFISIAFVIGMTACIKNDPVIYTNELAEFDATSWNANAAGVTYPLMVRVPIYGAATPTSSFTLHRSSGTVRLRVNMIGATSKSERTVGFKLFDVPFASATFPATPSGQTPSRAGATLTTAIAVPGTHYTAFGSTVTIPADSTWGYINLAILDAGATAGQARTIGISLDSTGTVKASPNYRHIAIAIDQR